MRGTAIDDVYTVHSTAREPAEVMKSSSICLSPVAVDNMPPVVVVMFVDVARIVRLFVKFIHRSRDSTT